MIFGFPPLQDLPTILGNDSTYEQVLKFAISKEISVGTTEDLWSYGGTLSYLTNAELINVVSSNAADTMDVIISGVDSDYNRVDETITLTGTTPVQTAKQFFRIFRAAIALDATAVNAGNVTLTASVSATVQAYIGTGIGQTEMSHYTIPAGYVGLLKSGFISVTGREDAISRVMTSREGGAFRAASVFNVNSPVNLDYQSQPVVFYEKTDVKLIVQALSNNLRAAYNLNLLLVKL